MVAYMDENHHVVSEEVGVQDLTILQDSHPHEQLLESAKAVMLTV